MDSGHHTHGYGTCWFVDAAPHKSLYVIGMWGADLGCRIWQAPAWVQSQQVAEPYGLQPAIKLAAYRGQTEVEIVGDNLATLQQVVHQHARAPLRHLQRILRRIHHAMRWGHDRPRIYWVASEYNPVDPVSRALQMHTAEAVHAKTQDVARSLVSTPSAALVFIGSARRRG